MKKEIIISLVIALISVIWIGSVFFRQTTTTPVSNSPSTTVAQQRTVTTDTVATHNTQSNCWIIIDGMAYDVTSYLTQHPGGMDTIIPYCGKNATTAYNAIRNGRGHSAAATQELESLLVGKVQ